MPVVAALCLGLPAATPAAAHAAKLIEFGWDEPDTAFMREHIREMEQTPFDGCVFHLTYTKEDGSKGNFTWECWGQKAFAREELWHAVDDLRALDSVTFRESFLRFNVTPGDVDWFGDFSVVLSNARLAAEIARAGGCPGIMFDIEQYNTALFNYQGLPHRDSKSFSEYAAQVRKRGAEVMEAFQSAYPDITVFLTFGYCLPWYQAGSPAKLPEAHYGLLAPFLDGMVEAANAGVKLVDGHEASYPYRELAQYESARKVMTEDLLPIVADPDRYLEHLSVAFGVWMDYNWRNVGWETGPFAGNHFLPMQLRRSIEAALSLCDEYVWIYTEQPRWWSAEGPQKLPRAYVRAVRKAKEEAEGG